MAGRRYSRGQWEEWISEQAHSGLPVSEFCRGKDLRESAFYYWRNKLASEFEAGQGAPQKAEAVFVPVAISATTEVEIALPCGATLRVPHDGPALQQVLKALFAIGTTA